MAYNMNEMRNALIKARELGNKRLIDSNLCAECGVSPGHYDLWVNGVDNLFIAVSEYVRVYNAPDRDDSAVKAAREKIFPLWKTLLACGEEDKFSHDLKVDPADVEHLAEWATKTVNDRNDLSFGTDEAYVAQKVYAVSPSKQFRKAIEINLGIRIAKVAVLTDTERDYLKAESSRCSKIRKSTALIKELEAQKTALEARAKKFKSKEAKDDCLEQIKAVEVRIAQANASITNWKAELDELHTTGKIEKKAVKPEEKKTAKAEVSSKKRKSTETLIIPAPAAA